MTPDVEDPRATPGGTQRRRVRVFVVLHLGAVGTIYAVALVAGGGFAGPPMPPLTVAMATLAPVPAAQAPVEVVPTSGPDALAPMPEWTRRDEISSPWASR